jgi:diguanylate cyclase
MPEITAAPTRLEALRMTFSDRNAVWGKTPARAGAPTAFDRASAEKAQRRLFDAIGAFIFQHRLAPTPANYMLAHMLVTKSSPAAVNAIESATNDGIRLTQEEANRILSEAGGQTPSQIQDEMLSAARIQMEEFARLVDETRREAETYGRDLEGSAALISKVPSSTGSAELIRITGAMIERTRVAEAQLAETTREAQALRMKLASAKEEALSDWLTGLPNRRAFEDRYQELSEAGTAACLAICDVDHFKSINDSHGHAVGDRVLSAVAHSLQRHCGGHMVARLGGEEFVILFEGIDAGEAARIVDNAREELAAKRFRARDTDAPIGSVTFSAGLVAGSIGESQERILKRADTMMYRAKQNGRNRVEICPG